MNEEFRSILIGTAGLSAAGVIALVLTFARGSIEASEARLRTTGRLAILVVLVQTAHFLEELATGFHWRFPELLGLTRWSDRFFVSFNLFWLAVWGLSIPGLAPRRRVALFPLWFLGIGCVVNALAHPSLALRTGGYFPGLVTSPFVGILGILLLRRLFLVTSP